jgi:hypothetical protein
MSFKENLLKKIRINHLAQKVLDSIGPPESGRKIDKEAMRSLLELSPYEYRKERDLDLFIEKHDDKPANILVLDNELPIYKTTVEDVAVRKSPFIKEMTKIRNIIKILKDSDVKLSRKEDSVRTIQTASIHLLDLDYDRSDIEEIAKGGSDSLQNGYADGIRESLLLFAELLGWQPPPKAFRVPHHEIYGAAAQKGGGEILYGPMVIFSLMDNALRMLDDRISNFDRKQVEFFQQVAQGREKATSDGEAVFEFLKKAVLNP